MGMFIHLQGFLLDWNQSVTHENDKQTWLCFVKQIFDAKVLLQQ